VNDRWASLEQPIATALNTAIEWRSPLATDNFAEYRDGDFLERVGLDRLRPELAGFWPKRGPQWNALAVGRDGEAILVEAKAHVGEMCSSPSGASDLSLELIAKSLASCADRLGAREGHAAWTEHFYQLANRLAHLQFILDHGAQAHLVLVNFLNDREMAGTTRVEAWDSA
jgi:hypothetical protein